MERTVMPTSEMAPELSGHVRVAGFTEMVAEQEWVHQQKAQTPPLVENELTDVARSSG